MNGIWKVKRFNLAFKTILLGIVLSALSIVYSGRFKVEFDIVAAQLLASFLVDRDLVLGIDVVVPVAGTLATVPVLVRRRDLVPVGAAESPGVFFCVDCQFWHDDFG